MIVLALLTLVLVVLAVVAGLCTFLPDSWDSPYRGER